MLDMTPILCCRYLSEARLTYSALDDASRYLQQNLVHQSSESCLSALLFQLTLPHRQNSPAICRKQLMIFFITLYIAKNLWNPVICVGGWKNKSFAFMLMPEASVHEHYGPILGQYDIWSARKRSHIFPVPKTLGKQILPYNFLRFCIHTANVRHIPASNFFRMVVSHDLHPARKHH